jgi:flagellar basal-body rod protein FlgB
MTTPIGLQSTPEYLMAHKALEISTLKHKACIANLANSETPGYKRVDVNPNFKEHLNRLLQSGRLEEYRETRPAVGVDQNAKTLRADGNTVAVHDEMMMMSNNALSFEFAADYLTDSLKQLQTAITGNNQQS